MEGYISLHRSILNHWLFNDSEKLKWWIDMLFMACYEDKEVRVGSQIIKLKRGQFIASISFMCNRWNRSKNMIISFQNLLITEKMITKESKGNVSVITICNFDRYQAKDNLLDSANGSISTNYNDCDVAVEDNPRDNLFENSRDNLKDNLKDNLQSNLTHSFSTTYEDRKNIQGTTFGTTKGTTSNENQGTQTNNNIINIEKEEDNNKLLSPKKENLSYVCDEFSFDKVWDLYDKKIGSKKKLIVKWNKLSLSTRKKIFDYIPRYKAAQPNKQFRKNFETFLNQESWNDELIYDERASYQQEKKEEQNEKELRERFYNFAGWIEKNTPEYAHKLSFTQFVDVCDKAQWNTGKVAKVFKAMSQEHITSSIVEEAKRRLS